jgi:hypothetical protein
MKALIVALLLVAGCADATTVEAAPAALLVDKLGGCPPGYMPVGAKCVWEDPTHPEPSPDAGCVCP